MKVKDRLAAEEIIGEYKFYIRYFGAWTAQRIGLKFKDVLAKAAAAAALEIAETLKNTDTENVFDVEVNADLIPALIKILGELDVKTLEDLTMEIIINHKNVAYVHNDNIGMEPKELKYDTADQIFSGDLQDMYILIACVIKANYKNFLDRLGTRFGGLSEIIQNVTINNTAN